VLGAGFLRPAPGSWGSLVAALAWLGGYRLAHLLDVAAPVRELAVCAVLAVSVGLCIRWGSWAVLRFGRADPSQFVLDEFAGQLVALLLLPAAEGRDLLFMLAGQFLLFRLLDVVKPPPARWVERLPEGWGIVADDLVAGAYANLLGQLLWRAGVCAWCVSAFSILAVRI
jgi:phosphatidylglycerophosphatase A